MHQIIIIGEAAGRLTPEFRAVHAHLLAWSQMKAMRNIPIHGYDEVKIERVWTVATEDLAGLALTLQDFFERKDDLERSSLRPTMFLLSAIRARLCGGCFVRTSGQIA